MKKAIVFMFSLATLSAIGTLHAQATVTPEFVMANNDLNKDGVITRAEANKAGKQLAQFWDQFDLNGDGKIVPAELKFALENPADGTRPAATATTAPPARTTTPGAATASAKAGAGATTPGAATAPAKAGAAPAAASAPAKAGSAAKPPAAAPVPAKPASATKPAAPAAGTGTAK